MPKTPLSNRNEAQIRVLTDEWVRAVRAKDIDAIMRHYAPDVVSFDVMPPAQLVGREAYRKRWQEWFDQGGPTRFDMGPLTILAAEDLAVCHALNQVSSRNAQGQEMSATVRATICFRKVGGQWLVVHEHASIPMTAPET